MAEVIAVAGLASKGSNLAPLRLISESVAGNDSVRYVDGGKRNAHGDLVVSPPSRQTEEIAQILEEQPERNYLIIAQSVGVLAALACVEKYPNTRLVAISPPIPHPSKIIRHPHFIARLQIEDGQLSLPSYSFALGNHGPTDTPTTPVELSFSSTIFEEVDDISPTFMDRLGTAANAGFADIVVSTEDWNQLAVPAATGLSRTHLIPGTHSLYAGNMTDLSHNVQRIASLAKQ